MADATPPVPAPKTASNTRSLLTLGVIGTILMFLLDQGRIMRRLFGPLAQLVGLTFEGAVKLLQEAGAAADDWVRECLSNLKSVTYWLVMAAIAAFIVAFALEAKGYGGAGTICAIVGGVILVVTLTIWEVAIQLMMMAAMLGVHVADDTLSGLRRKLGLVSASPQPMTRGEIEAALATIKQTGTRWIAYLRLAALGITAFVITFSLSWTGLGLAVTLAFMGWVIDSFRSSAEKPSKTGLLVVALVFTAAVALKFAAFLLLMWFPELGTYHRLPIGEWPGFLKPGPLGWLALLAVIPVTLLIVSGFDKKRAEGWRMTAKVATVVMAAIALLLWRRGVLTPETLGLRETHETRMRSEPKTEPLDDYKPGPRKGGDDIKPPPPEPSSDSGRKPPESPASRPPDPAAPPQDVSTSAPQSRQPLSDLAPTPYKTPGEAGLDLLNARGN